jgi:hypothetical protein
MTRINCSGKDCSAFIEVSGPAVPSAKYTCRIHTGEDTKNQDLRFQSFAHDKNLDRVRDGSKGMS